MDTQNDAWEMVIPFEYGHLKGIYDKFLGCTLPETDSEFRPENWWSEYDTFLFGAFEAYLQGRTVRFGECRGWSQRGQ